MPLLAPAPASEESSPAGVRSAGMAIAGLAAGIGLLYYGRAFCITVIVSVILAFLLEPIVSLLIRIRIPRAVGSVLVCTAALGVVYLAGLFAVTQLANFAEEDLPAYSARLNTLVDRVAVQLEETEKNVTKLVIPKRFQERPQDPEPQPTPPTRKRKAAPAMPPSPPPIPEVRIQQDRASLMNYLAGYFSSMYNTLLMISFVPFLVYFMLSWGEHITQSFLATYNPGDRLRAGRSWQSIANIARAYVVGNVILGLIIALASCAIFYTWRLPYWILVGFISGFLSLVPYVGLPLAMFPPALAALMTYDTVTPYLLISAEVAAVHLLALNLLYPAVVGARVHLNPLAVTIALMFWGTLWGGIGLVLAIPITAALKAFLDNTQDLHAWGRLLGDQGAPPVARSSISS